MRVKTMARLMIASLSAGLAMPAMAAEGTGQVLDCPMAKTPFSIDSPLIDILNSPAAKAAASEELGDAFTKLNPFLTGTHAPTFSVIVTLRSVFAMNKADPATMAKLDARLRQLPVTPADEIIRCARYDNDAADPRPAGKGLHVLIFEKINGFLDKESVATARNALQSLAKDNGWSMQVTDKGGAIRPDVLRRYDLVIWNNISGDALTLTQRKALKDWVEQGGGFVGIHGAAGDPATFWDWYTDKLVGARFLGHPSSPQFQSAKLRVEPGKDPVTKGIPAEFAMTDEWYSFRANPRREGVRVLLSLDETTYSPPSNLVMGKDHPIAWKQCVGKGRSFYSAIGHVPATFTDPNYRRFLTQGIEWAGKPDASCAKAGK